jgi:hypothetical protein
MTTFAAPQDTERRHAELAARTRDAWEAYRAELAGLHGQAYVDTELLAWDGLQATLRELEALRADLPPAGGERS